MSAREFSLDELEGAPFDEKGAFVSCVKNHWAWDAQGELWRVTDYVRQEYWGERVLEVQSVRGGWGKNIRQGELRAVDFERARWLRELPPERLAEIGKALAERWALREELSARGPAAQSRRL